MEPVEKPNSPLTKAEKRKEVIRKIRDGLKRAAAKNKLRLHRKTTSVTRRLHKSSLIKSHHSSVEASLYERTLLFNNRKLAHALQNMRQENRLLQDQNVTLKQEKLDLEVKQAELNSQLIEQQHNNGHKDKQIAKLGNIFLEAAEVFHDMNYEKENAAQDNEVTVKKLALQKSSYDEKPSRILPNSLQEFCVSSNEGESTSGAYMNRPTRISNPFDLSAILEVSNKSLNDSACQRYLDSEKGSPAVLETLDSGKFRRETFVVHASRQISDLPTPIKNPRSRIKMRRSNSYEPVFRLSESPEKHTEVKNIESTTHFPVDMEMTCVLQTPILLASMGGNVLVNAEKSFPSGGSLNKNNDIVNSINDALVKEADVRAEFEDADTLLEVEKNHSINNIETDKHVDESNRNFRFVTERLSYKSGKRSTASSQTSQVSGSLLEASIHFEPEEHLKNSSDVLEECVSLPEFQQVIPTQFAISSPKLPACQVSLNIARKSAENFPTKSGEMETIGKINEPEKKMMDGKCAVTTIIGIPAKGLEENPEEVSTEVDNDGKSNLPYKKKRVSFAENQLPPICYSKKGKSKRKQSATKETFTVKNDGEGLSQMQSPTRNTEILAGPKRSSKAHISDENMLILEDTTLTRKTKKSPLRKKSRSRSAVGSFEETTKCSVILERSALEEVSPNRLGLKPMENFSPNHGKPYVRNVQNVSKEKFPDPKNDCGTVGRTCRSRTAVVYKEPSVNRKMRRQ